MIQELILNGVHYAGTQIKEFVDTDADRNGHVCLIAVLKDDPIGRTILKDSEKAKVEEMLKYLKNATLRYKSYEVIANNNEVTFRDTGYYRMLDNDQPTIIG